MLPSYTRTINLRKLFAIQRCRGKKSIKKLAELCLRKCGRKKNFSYYFDEFILFEIFNIRFNSAIFVLENKTRQFTNSQQFITLIKNWGFWRKGKGECAPGVGLGHVQEQKFLPMDSHSPSTFSNQVPEISNLEYCESTPQAIISNLCCIRKLLKIILLVSLAISMFPASLLRSDEQYFHVCCETKGND